MLQAGQLPRAVAEPAQNIGLHHQQVGFQREVLQAARLRDQPLAALGGGLKLVRLDLDQRRLHSRIHRAVHIAGQAVELSGALVGGQSPRQILRRREHFSRPKAAPASQSGLLAARAA